MPDDLNVVKKVLAGEPAGLNALLARHGHELAEYVRAFAPEDDRLFADIYEDILVDVLRQIRLAGERRNGKLRLFIFQSAARTLRRRYPDLLKSDPHQRMPEGALEDVAEIREPTLPELQHSMRALPALERELLFLRYRMKFSYGEISDILREARVQFEDRMLRARVHFRAKLASSQMAAP